MNKNDLLAVNGNIQLAFLIKETEIEYTASRGNLDLSNFETSELHGFLSRASSELLQDLIRMEILSRKEINHP